MDQAFSAAVAAIYDAALDVSRWPDAMPLATAYVGGQAGGLIAKDRLTSRATMLHYCGVEPRFIESYLETYWRYDTFGIVESTGFEVGEPITTDDLIPYEDFKLGRLYREWAVPQGWVDSAWVVLDRSATHFGFFSVLRDAATGRVDAPTRERLATIAPHLRRAVVIGNVIGAARNEAESFAAALEGIGAAVFFVDDEGRLLHVNAAGRRMLEQPGPMRLNAGRLGATTADAEALLQRVWGRGRDDLLLEPHELGVASGQNERYLVNVLPLASDALRPGGAVAAVFVRPQKFPAPTTPDLLARAYDLTPSELRVLLAIVDVGGVPEVATALGVAETTVRTHLARLYAKTGLNRQADLVKLVASFASPVGS